MNQQSKSGLGRRIEVSRSLTIRQTHSHTGRNSLNEWSTTCYLHNMQQTGDMNFHALSGIWSLDPSNPAAADLGLRPHDHQHRHTVLCEFKKALMAEERGKTVQSQMVTVEMHFLTFDVGHSLFLKRRNGNVREEFTIFKLTIAFEIE